MSMPPLNLASRPFRNERLAALLLALGFTAAGAISVRHAMAVRSLMPGRTSGLARQVRQLEDERSRLRSEAGSLRAPRPEPGTVAQWVLLKDLVDKRAFAWSDLFRVLEETLPRSVRLDTIAPSVQKGEITVDLTAMARSNEDALELITALQKRPEFEEVLPLSRSDSEQQIRVQVTMKYRPPRTPSVAMAGATAAIAPPAGPLAAASPGAGPGAAMPGHPASPGAASPAQASGGPAASPAAVAAEATPAAPLREAPVAAPPGQSASPAAQPGGPRSVQRRPPARPRTPPAPEGLH